MKSNCPPILLAFLQNVNGFFDTIDHNQHPSTPFIKELLLCWRQRSSRRRLAPILHLHQYRVPLISNQKIRYPIPLTNDANGCPALSQGIHYGVLIGVYSVCISHKLFIPHMLTNNIICDTLASHSSDRRRMQSIEKINQAREIAIQMVDTLQDITDNDMELSINTACIAFVALAVAHDMSLHKAISLLMLIHKNTELVKD